MRKRNRNGAGARVVGARIALRVRVDPVVVERQRERVAAQRRNLTLEGRSAVGVGRVLQRHSEVHHLLGGSLAVKAGQHLERARQDPVGLVRGLKIHHGQLLKQPNRGRVIGFFSGGQDGRCPVVGRRGRTRIERRAGEPVRVYRVLDGDTAVRSDALAGLAAITVAIDITLVRKRRNQRERKANRDRRRKDELLSHAPPFKWVGYANSAPVLTGT